MALCYIHRMKTALLASYEKDSSLLRLAELLHREGWELLGSQGTAKYLRGTGIPCRDISDLVGPPIMGHRVVTLARKVYAALLGVTAEDYRELDRINVRPINLVYVTLYPLEQAIADNEPESKVLEKTDIGGPTLLRAAGKGRRLALSHPAQIEELEVWLTRGSPESEREALTLRFAAAAERRVADYVDASARYWESKVT